MSTPSLHSHRVRAVAAVAAFAASLGVAYAAAGPFAGGGSSGPSAAAGTGVRAPAAAGEAPEGPAIPLVAPIASNVDPAELLAAGPADPGRAGDGVPLSPVVGTLVSAPDDPADYPVGGRGPGRTTASSSGEPDHPGGPGEPPEGHGAGDATGDGTVFLDRFVDPCAGAEPGEGSGDADPDCEEGVSGTVFAAIRSPEPMWAMTLRDLRDDSPAESAWRRCVFPDGPGVTVVVLTNNPADRVTLTTGLEGEPPERAATIDVPPTSGEEIRLWDSRETYPEQFYDNLQHCTRVPTPDRGTRRWVVAEVEGEGGTAVADLVWVDGRDMRPRPPVRLSYDGIGTVSVSVPVRQGAGERSQVVALRASGADGPLDCAALEAAPADTIAAIRDQGRVREMAAALATPVPVDEDGPYLPTYDAVQQHRPFELDEGETYRLCIRWTAQRRSFDPARVTEREQWIVRVPDRLRVEMRVLGFELAHGIDADSVTIGVRDASNPYIADPSDPGRSCAATLPVESLRAGRHGLEPVHLCGSGGRVGDLPETVDLWARWTDADPNRVRIPLDLDPTGGPRNEVYRVGLTATQRLCGGSPFGSGCGDDVRDDLGAVLLEVVYTNGAVNGTHHWLSSAAGAWASGDDATTGPPERPQIDLFWDMGESVTESRSRVTATAGRVDAIDVRFVTDRDVTARAFIVPDPPGSEPCLREGSGETTGAARAGGETVLRIEGLCARTQYSVALELVDAEGRRSVFTGHPEREADGVFWPGAQTRTYGWQTVYSVEVRVAGLEYDRMLVVPWRTTLDGDDLGFLRAGPHEGEESANGCYSRNSSFYRRDRRDWFGETVVLDVDWEAGWRESGSGCVWVGSDDPPPERAATRVEIPVAALADGSEDLTVSSDGEFALVVRIFAVHVSAGSGAY